MQLPKLKYILDTGNDEPVYLGLSKDLFFSIERVNGPLPASHLDLLGFNNTYHLPLVFDCRGSKSNKTLEQITKEKSAIEKDEKIVIIVEEGAPVDREAIALRLSREEMPGNKEEQEILRRRLKKGEWRRLKDCIENRSHYLGQLSNSLDERLGQRYRQAVGEAKSLDAAFAEAFLSEYGNEVDMLSAFGTLQIDAMQTSKMIIDLGFGGAFTKELDNELDFYGERWLAWSLTAELSQVFAGRLEEESNFLKADESNSLAEKVKALSGFYTDIAVEAIDAEKQMQTLLAQALFLFGIYDSGTKLPHLKGLKERIGEKLGGR